MDERTLFDRFHEAFDVEPGAGAYDRFRIALAKSPVKAQRHPVAIGWSRTGLRLAAVMTIGVLAIAALAALLATHRVADRVTPADSEHAIAAYKVMLADDSTKVTTAAAAWTCTSGSQFAACEADASSILPIANQFLKDLDRSQPPTRFAIVHAQLRLHVAVQNARTQALIAASRAHDAAAADRELAALNGQTGGVWGSTIIPSILNSRQRTVATYVESVRSEKQTLDQCAECQDLAAPTQISCTASQWSSCQDLVNLAASQVKTFQAAVVVTAAPTSLAAKDTRLQLDLGNAETALKAMVDALAADDQARFNSGRISYQQAMAAINRDATDILNG